MAWTVFFWCLIIAISVWHIRSKRLSNVTHLSYDVLMDDGVKLDCPGGQALDADSYHAIGTGG